jgi:hypothetical protein
MTTAFHGAAQSGDSAHRLRRSDALFMVGAHSWRRATANEARSEEARW